MRSSLALFSLLWAGLLAAIFLFTHGGALLVLSLHLRTLLCGLLPVLVFYPLAWRTIRWLDKSRTLPGDEALPYALFTALAYASAAGFLLLTVGLGTPLMLLLVCGLGLIGSLRWWKNALSAKEFQSVLGSFRGGTAVERILFLLAGGMVLCAALVPPLGYDAHEYHLAVPQVYLTAGGWVAMPLNVYAGFPMNAEMLYLWPLALQSSAGCTVINGVLALVGALALLPLGRRWGIQANPLLAPLIFLSTAFVLKLIVQANIDLALTAAAAILFLAYERYRQDASRLDGVMLALALGFALGAKYIAILSILFPLTAVVLYDICISREWRRGVGVSLFMLGGGLLFVPWLIRNQWLYANPFYPLLFSWFGGEPAFYSDLFRAAHAAPLLSPWQQVSLFFTIPLQKTVGSQHLAGFSLLGLAGLPVFYSERTHHPAWRGLCFVFCAYLLWFFATQRNDRFLASVIPVLSLLPALLLEDLPCMEAKRWLHSLILGVVGIQLWFSSLFVFHTETVDYLQTPTLEPLYLADALPHYRAIDWLNQEKKERGGVGKVLFLGEAQTYGAEFSCLAATVFNFHPAIEGDGFPPGVTHILYNQFELDRLDKGYGPLGWPLGAPLRAWFEQAKETSLTPVHDAYPEKPGHIMVYQVRR